MADSIALEVVTPERLLLKEEIRSMVVPASGGYLGVLPGHAPLVTGLTPGVVRYRVGEQRRKLAVSGGFMEVAHNRAVLLADTAEAEEEIDVNRAQRARERAERRLRDRTQELDVVRAEMALRRAMARLKAAGQA